MSKNILLLFGGGGNEHDISKISSDYLEKCLLGFNVEKVEIKETANWHSQKHGQVTINFQKQLLSIKNEFISSIDYVVPCIHGPPGENGVIQSFLEIIGLPFMGAGSEASQICFNKVSTKLWLDKVGIATTEWMLISSLDEDKTSLKNFLQKHPKVFIKASSEGSSVGCYMADGLNQAIESIQNAKKYGPYVLVEKAVEARELEVSVFEYQGRVWASYPGEIKCPSKFYSYEEKYSQSSQTTTLIKAPNLSNEVVTQIKDYALKAFKLLNLRHLSRIDFFLDENGQVLLNEINTFPGLTPISMFPKMLENEGITFRDFVQDIVNSGPY